jgi:hypothetical protein
VLITNIVFTTFVLNSPEELVRELLGILKQDVKQFIRQRRTDRELSSSPGPSLLLSPSDEIVLFLIHHRHYIPDILLAATFQICKSTANRTHHRIRHWMYQLLKPEISFYDLRWRIDHGGILFWNQLFTFIVDGSEQQVLSSDNTIQNGLHYSTKKSWSSLNIVLWVSLDGHIMHLSQSYPGGKNDDSVLKMRNEQHWIHYLEPHESGFGDSGFDGFEQWRIFSVPPVRNDLYSRVAHYRIMVEQTIEKIKNFGSCGDVLRFAIAQQPDDSKRFHQESWTIAAAFINRYYLK